MALWQEGGGAQKTLDVLSKPDQLLEDLFGENAPAFEGGARGSGDIPHRVLTHVQGHLIDDRLSFLVDSALVHIGRVRLRAQRTIIALLSKSSPGAARLVLNRILSALQVLPPDLSLASAMGTHPSGSARQWVRDCDAGRGAGAGPDDRGRVP
jgi:hypothetical protein